MRDKDQVLLEEAYDDVVNSTLPKIKIPQFKYIQSEISKYEEDDASSVTNRSWDVKFNGERVGELKEFGYGESKATMVTPLKNPRTGHHHLDLKLSGEDDTIEMFKRALETKTGQKYLARLKQLGATYIK